MSAKQKILIARIGAVGDVCMALPVVKALSAHFNVHWLIRRPYVSIARFFPDVSFHAVRVNPQKRFDFRPWLPRILRKEKYSAFLDFSHWASVSRLASRLSSIPIRAITYDPELNRMHNPKKSPSYLYTPYNHQIAVDPSLHQVEKWQVLIRETLNINVELDWNLPTLKSRGEVLQVFVHPHSGNASKRWPRKNFEEVLLGLAKSHKLNCHINCGRPLEWVAALCLQDRMKRLGIMSSLVPFDFSFSRLKNILVKMDFAFGTDSGPMHLAGLLGTSTFVVYGRFPAKMFRPLWRSTAIEPEMPGQNASSITSDRVLKTILQSEIFRN